MIRISIAVAASTLGGCAGLLGFEGTSDLSVTELDVSPGVLSPAFDPAVTAYTLDAPYGTASFEVTAASSSPSAALAIGKTSLAQHAAITIQPEAELELVATTASGVSVSYTIAVHMADFGIDFAPPTTATATGMSDKIVAGDIDGDGTPDLVVSNIGSSQVSILRGTGTGAFTTTDVMVNGNAIGVGRLDANNSSDLVVGQGNLFAALADGSGGFSPFGMAKGSISVYSVSVADFDGDHHGDIAFGTNGAVRIQSGDGTGAFNDGPILSGPMAPSQLAVGDFDGDGTLDIAALDPASSSVWVMLAPSSPSPHIRAIAAGNDSTALVAADFDGDGRADLAIAHAQQQGAVEVLTHIDGATEHHDQYPVGPQPVSLAAADFDGDGHVDLAVANGGGSPMMTVLHSDGAGHFTAKAFPLTQPVHNLAAADFDHDGRVDLAYTTVSSTVCILRGKP